MRHLFFFILLTGVCFSEESEKPKPLPKDVQTIVDAREADLQAARVAFDKAVVEANKKAITKMEAQVKSSTQKGDLDGALASKKFVEEWNKENETASIGSVMGGGGPAMKKDDLVKLMVDNVWQFNRKSGEYLKLVKGGTVLLWWANKPFSETNLPDTRGTWRKDKETILLNYKWSGQHNWTITDGTNDEIHVTDSDGVKFSLIRPPKTPDKDLTGSP